MKLQSLRGGGLLTQGPISTHLWNMTLPMIIGIFSIIAFNVADTYFIAKLGTEYLAAFSYTFPVVLAFGSIAVGLGAGAASVISRAIGERDGSKVRRLATDSLTLSMVIVVTLLVVGYLTIDPVFTLLGASASERVLIAEYMKIWYPGMFFLIIPMVGNNIIRATGDTKFPALLMVGGAIFNIILDPILIFGLYGAPAMGLQGGAIATVIARALTLVASLSILIFREKLIVLHRVAFSKVMESWKSIVAIGVPAAANNLIGPISIAIITRFVSGYGPEAIAGFGVATRIESFSLVIVFALATGLAPIVGQNWGAGNIDRVKETIRLSHKFCLAWGLLAALVLGLFPETITKLFDSNLQVITVASAYLFLVPISYGGEGVLITTNFALNALGKPLKATILTITRMFILYIPLAFIGKSYFGIYGIFLAACTTNLAIGLIAHMTATITCNNLKTELA